MALWVTSHPSYLTTPLQGSRLDEGNVMAALFFFFLFVCFCLKDQFVGLFVHGVLQMQALILK